MPEAPSTFGSTETWLAASFKTSSWRDTSPEADVMRLMGRADLLHRYLLQASVLSEAEKHAGGQRPVLADVIAGFMATMNATSIAASTKGRGDAYQRWSGSPDRSSVIPEVFEPSIRDAAEALNLPASTEAPTPGSSRTTSNNHHGLAPVRCIWASVLTVLTLSITIILVVFSS